MTHASLFSGIGGAEIAATWMGWTNAFHCEINPFGHRVLEYWCPNSINYEDITKTDFSRWRGQIDILTAGFPCQPFSLAGSRKGAEDDRYLWPQVVRAIREIQPRWFVGENVAGILTMVQPGSEVEMGREAALFSETDRKRVLLQQEYTVESICASLEREGYSVQPFVIPACAVGAPHRRDRVWFVARRIAPYAPCHGGSGAPVEPSQTPWGQNGCEVEQPFIRSEVRIATHAPSQQGERCELEQRGNGKQEQGKLGGSGCEDGRERPFAHACHARRMEQHAAAESGEADFNPRLCAEELPALRWRDFPTQSPVCSRDDEFSDRLVGITFPKWRAEATKALGNAWVPQVAYEIFRAIRQVEYEAINI